MYIIIKDREHKLGKTRSEQCENLRKEGMGCGGLSDELLDKCKWLEKRHNKAEFIPSHDLDEKGFKKYEKDKTY